MLICKEVNMQHYVNADKTECMCFNQRGDISILKGGPLKLADKFTYLGNSVLSTKNDISMWLAKAIDHMEVRPDQ